MDGAFVITADGHIERSRQKLLDSAQADIQLTQGLGTRHWAAAAISKVTKAVAVVVRASRRDRSFVSKRRVGDADRADGQSGDLAGV